VVTTLNTYGLPLLDLDKLGDLNLASLTAALPGTLAFFALLGETLTLLLFAQCALLIYPFQGVTINIWLRVPPATCRRLTVILCLLLASWSLAR